MQWTVAMQLVGHKIYGRYAIVAKDAYSERFRTLIPIEGGHRLRTKVDRVSETMMDAFPSSIGMGVHLGLESLSIMSESNLS